MPRSIQTSSPVRDAIFDSISPTAVARARTNVYLGSGPVRVGKNLHIQDNPLGVDAGLPLSVNYSRFFPAGDPSDPVVQMTMHVRADGLDLGSFSQPVPDRGTYGTEFSLAVPEDARGSLEFWFEGTTRRGAQVWDSQGGENFELNILPKATARVSFGEAGESLVGTLRAGSAFELAYDVDRLYRILGAKDADAGGTSLTANVSFDGQPPLQLQLSNNTSEGVAMSRPRVEIPENATSMRIWFYGKTPSTRLGYDSNGGQDFRFHIAPAGTR